MISFGALAAFSLVNLSVIKHFFIDNKQRGGSSAVRYGWVPAIGFLLTLWLWTSLSQITFEVGITWVAIGLLYLAYLTRGFQRSVPDINIAGG
jgi:amino acid transporter